MTNYNMCKRLILIIGNLIIAALVLKNVREYWVYGDLFNLFWASLLVGLMAYDIKSARSGK